MLCGYDNCFGSNICGKMIENPNFGQISFDNIFYSFLNVFQSITLEGWTQIMFYYVRTFSIFMVFFFIPLVWVGAYFLVNLTLAVINTTFNQSIEKKGELKDEEVPEIDPYAITIEDIRNMKLGERSHHKRFLRIMDKKQVYGAKEEDHLAEKNQFEIRWDDLLELKERIKEEQERNDAEEEFKKIREKELDKKEKVKKKVFRKINLKYLPRLSKKEQFSIIHSKALPLKFLLRDKKSLRPIKLLGICGVEHEKHAYKSITPEKIVKKDKRTHSIDKNSIFCKEKPDKIETLSILEEKEEDFLEGIEKLKGKKELNYKDPSGVDIFSLKNNKNTKFFVKEQASRKSKQLQRNQRKKAASSLSPKPNKIIKNLSLKLLQDNKSVQKRKLTVDENDCTDKSLFITKTSLKEKNTPIHEYFIEKLAKEDNLREIKGLDFSSNNISSNSSNLSDSLIYDSDFNIEFSENPYKEGKIMQQEIYSSASILSEKKKREKNVIKLKNEQSKKSKTSIVLSQKSHKIRASRIIMSSLIKDLENEQDELEKAAKNDISYSDKDENNQENYENNVIKGKNEAIWNEKNGEIEEKNIFRDFAINNPMIKKKLHTDDIFGLSRGKNIEKLKKEGLFKRLFTINNSHKKIASLMVTNNPNSPNISPTSRRRRGIPTEISLIKFQKEMIIKNKKANIFHYKMMINPGQTFYSASQEAVLKYRQEKEKERKEKQLEEKIHSVKYKISYSQKPFVQKKLSKQEIKKQRQLLKEVENAKKKYLDYQLVDNRNLLRKVLNIKENSKILPLKMRFDLMSILQQQREILFGGKTRSNKTFLSNSHTTNVSMISNATPSLREKVNKKKKKKKIVEIDEKLGYEELCVKLKEQLILKTQREEIEKYFSNRIDLMSIRVLF